MEERKLDRFLDLPVLPAIYARSNLATSLAELGAFPQAAANAAEAVRRANAIGQPESIVWAYWSTGLVALIQGASQEAVRVFAELLNFCETHDLDAYPSRIMAALGRTKARLGQIDEGHTLLEHSVALHATAEPQTTHSFALISLSEAHFLSGDLENAMTRATQAKHMSRRNEERSSEAYATWLLALIHDACAAEPEAALGMLQAATAIANELRLKPLWAHCQLGLGELYEKRGYRSEATEHRQRGQSLFETLA